MKKQFAIIVLCAMAMSFSPAFAQSDIYNDTQEQKTTADESAKEESPFENAMKLWLSDSKTLQQIVNPLRKYKIDFSDTDIIKDEKKRKLNSFLLELNKKYKGKVLELHQARCKNVEAEKKLSKYGEQQAKKIITDLKKHPDGKYLLQMGKSPETNFLLNFYLGLILAFCDKCYQPTGYYVAEYDIPVPEQYSQSLNYNEFSRGIYTGNIETETMPSSDDIFNNRFYDVIIYKRLQNKHDALSIRKNEISPLKVIIEKIIYKSQSDDIYIHVK